MANDLVVQLGARLDQFANDMNQAGDIADSAVSRIESSFASLNPGVGLGGLASISAGATAGVTLLLAALQHVNSELADIAKNAEYVGVSVERFQSLQFAATQGGVSSEQATADLRNVARLLADAKENENSLTKLLETNNIKYKDRNGNVVATNQLLLIAGDLINRFHSMPEKVEAAKALGLSEQWVQALRNGGKAFDDVANSAQAAGAVIDKSTVAKAEAFDIAWKKSTALLSSQFKAAAGDVAVFLDGLIDKAVTLIDGLNASNGTASGSGQEKFNKIADAIAIEASARAGTLSVEQLERAIEILQSNKQIVAPEVFEQFAQMKADADKAAASAKALLTATSAAAFPGGVPVPGSRPKTADDPSDADARLAKRRQEANDAYDRAQETVAKHTAKMDADSVSVGQGAAKLEELRANAILATAAMQAGIPVTGAVADKIQDLAQDAGIAAEALARAKVASETDFGRKTSFLTREDLQIAQQLREIYGNDIPGAMQSAEAAGLRFNNALKQISDVGQDVNRGLFVELGQNIRNGSSAWDSFSKAGVSALGKIADKLSSMAADKLWASAFGGSSGNIFSSLFGGSGINSNGSIAGAVGATSVGGAPLVGAFASGTDSAPGGWSLIGENGPEIMNVPTGAQIIPNDILRSTGGAGPQITYAPSYDARGASVEAVARLEQLMAQDRASFETRTVRAIQSARRGRVPGV